MGAGEITPTIILNATAADTDGTISKVEFLNGTTSIATVTQSPYKTNWENVAQGSYSITAKATDNLGVTTTSAPVPVAVTKNVPKMYDIHTDHLNTPRVITDNTGTEVWRWDSAPFGETLPNEQPQNNASKFVWNQRFPGQYYDEETGLHYNYFRDYDPQSGRYVQSDPIGLGGGINTYAYVKNEPTQVGDVLGLVKGVKSGANANFGEGYTGRIDPVPGTDIWEIHVFDPKGKEIGMYNEGGWFNKHGHEGAPKGIPKGVEEQIQGNAIEQMRKRGVIPAKGLADIKDGKWKKFAKICRGKAGPIGVVVGVAVGLAMGTSIQEMAEDSVCGIGFGCSEAQ
ncbi:MAG: hypothetical protein HY254_23200 [Burkholderiales bacterium]|nr:hypothetical protein [Burkholderiales bacterium]